MMARPPITITINPGKTSAAGSQDFEEYRGVVLHPRELERTWTHCGYDNVRGRMGRIGDGCDTRIGMGWT